jgi:hypothetical protein
MIMNMRRIRQRANWILLAIAVATVGAGLGSHNDKQVAIFAVVGILAIVSLIAGSVSRYQWRWQMIKRGWRGR